MLGRAVIAVPPILEMSESLAVAEQIYWKQRVQRRVIMFGIGFEDCWYKVPGVLSLELSGDLRFRGPRGLRQARYDCNGRPYVIARKVVGHESDG